MTENQEKKLWDVPDEAATVFKPDDEILETEKFADNGTWFMNYARWIVKNFYNAPILSFSDDVGNLLTDALVGRSLNYADEITHNFSFYFGRQPNDTFKMAEQSATGAGVFARHIPGHKIFQLVSSMEGKVQEMIEPLRHSMAAVSLNSDTMSQKLAKADKIRQTAHLKKLLKPYENIGLEFAPNVPDFDSDAERERYIKDIRDEIEINAVNHAKGIYLKNDLDTQLLYDGLYQLVAGICGTFIEEMGDEVVHKMIPAQNLIIDNRCKDPYFSDAMVGGFVEWYSPSEVFAMYPHAFRSHDERTRLEKAVAARSGEGKKWVDYYNKGFQYMNWWNTKDNKVAVARVFWLSRKDLRARRKVTQTGGIQYVQEINDDNIYDIDQQKKKGKDIAGDDWVWQVHYCDLIGNRWPVDYGYYPYQIKPPQKRAMPELPVKMFAARYISGHFESIVSRLKSYQQLRDYYKIKIQEIVAASKGKNYIINGSKLGESVTAPEIVNDFDQMNLSVIEGASGLPAIQSDGGRLVEIVDMTMDPNVTAIIELYRMEAQDMEELTSTSPLALGQERKTGIGLGVQENSIQRSTLGQKALYEGLQEFWRRKMQYSINVDKWIKFKKGKEGLEEPVMVSPNEMTVIKYTPRYRYEDLWLYIQPNDAIEGKNEMMLQQMLQAYGQNPDIGYEAMLMGLKILEKPTYREAITELEHFAEMKKEEKMREMAAAEESEQARIAQQQGMLAMMEQMKALRTMVEKAFAVNLEKSWDGVNQAGTHPSAPAIIQKSEQFVDQNMPQGQPNPASGQ